MPTPACGGGRHFVDASNSAQTPVTSDHEAFHAILALRPKTPRSLMFEVRSKVVESVFVQQESQALHAVLDAPEQMDGAVVTQEL